MMVATLVDRQERTRIQSALFQNGMNSVVRSAALPLRRQTCKGQISGLIATLRKCDPDTWAHSLRVKQYAVLFAEALNFGCRAKRRLGLAAMLHDIGKLQVPHEILLKPGFLTEQERAVVQQHPAAGEKMLLSLLRSRSLLQTIRGHHERFDGGGYPDGLKGQQIPLQARLLAIADCFDAMTSARSYKRAFSWTEALDLLRQGAGSQFDPDLLPGCIAALIRCDGRPEFSTRIQRPQYFSQVPSQYFFHGEARTLPNGAPIVPGVKFSRMM